MRVVTVGLVILLIVLQLQLWRQHARVGELQAHIETQHERNQELKARNDALAAEVLDLKSGLDAVEERARSELGLIRQGEEFYMVVDPNDLDPADAASLKAMEAASEPLNEKPEKPPIDD
ncbi:MAG: cell division protein FtsB [Wenzhouxiangellaceae bacterium]|nr:cell division protein FtsB [Wenzhouxiangellaceae bacterium]